ncbi:MAG: hypothetical protein GQ474_10020, partial [Sulfurimonas sp.]|nr:hypothetical protein [Sulfurimonas sp.]
ELDRLFPLFGHAARKEGYDLPKPFGISLINMFQETDMQMTSFEIEGSSIDFNQILGGDSLYKSLTYAPLVRVDMWLLPFLNVGVIVGGTKTVTEVTLHSPSGLVYHSPLPLPGGTDYTIIEPNSKITLDTFGTNALLYGVGATVAGGVGNYFSTIDFQYIVAYTEAADVSLDMLIITPIIGYNFSSNASKVFIGAQYQYLTEAITFEVASGGETLSGKVGLRSEQWAGVIGTDYSFTRHWNANLLYSQGKDRKNVILGIGYRW